MVRVRFAPSPTGYLHVGGARTAIFNWLLARRQGGVFVLRVEDTDKERSKPEHTQAILDGLNWLGVDWDEGPIFQSEGVERHRADALRLLAEGKAYRDFSDPASVRAEAEARGWHPSKVAREFAFAMSADEADAKAAAGEPFAVRFLVPDGETLFTDMVHGEMRFGSDDIDDLVILRGDGTPVYNLAVVSDDADMAITHVVRGDDHLSNTPKQVLLYRALGYSEPAFGHVPLILGTDGKRLSKRHGATAVGEYASKGVLPEAMFNFLSLLGWSPGDDREVMQRAELIEAFTMERVLKSSSVFDVDKLAWINGRHLALKPIHETVAAVRTGLTAIPGVDPERLSDDPWMTSLVGLHLVRARTVDDLVDQLTTFVVDEVELEEASVAKHWAKDLDLAYSRLESAAEALRTSEWSEEALEGSLRGLAERLEVGAGKVIHPLRVAITGRMASAGIFEVLVLLGREQSMRRVAAGMRSIACRKKDLS
ncbi:MAG: glutamate--tRNA ligase [Gemmatimonadetes bacterium]|nr:glutamate--tRNA ligase [Gemmatimonadota bacterium]